MLVSMLVRVKNFINICFLSNSFSQNMYYIKDNTVKSLKTVRNNTNLVLLFNDKDSS